MTATPFGLGVPLAAVLTAIDNAVLVVARARDWLGWFMRQARSIHRRAMERRQLAHSDDRILRDIGLRRDHFPWAVRERLRSEIEQILF
jgi:hypothetical protein